MAGLACFAAGWQWRVASQAAPVPDANAPGKSGQRPLPELQGRGDGLLSGWASKVEAAGDSELEELAALLTKEPRGSDLALWIPLLARWSEADGAGMISFLESKAPPALREQLLSQAWFAWGASDPDAAFAAGRKLKPDWASELLQGIAENDPRKAVECVWQMPDAQFNISAVAARVIEKASDLAEGLLARAVYDGGRYPIETEWVSTMAVKDPAQAVALAKRWGNIGWDPVPRAIGEIAKHDPAQAAEQIALMPSNRSKALSAVTLAKVWAASDAEAAAAWIRGNVEGPAKHYALVNAAASASTDPELALNLLQEAGTEPDGDFFNIYRYDIGTGEAHEKPDAHAVTVDLLRRLVATDPAKARSLAAGMPGEGPWQQWAVEAGIQP